MSQTETLMLVALGFVAASFVALVLGRVLWKLARRLDRRRRDSQVPTVIAGLKADRDRLRAELAMQSRKVDVRLGEMKARLAEQMAEVSRHRNRLESLAEEFHKREAALAERENEREGMRAQLAPLESELAKRTETIQALKEQLRDKDETITRLDREVAELRATVAEQDRELDELEAGARPLSPTLTPEMLTSQERLTRHIEDLTALSQEIASQREQFAEERDRLSALRQAIAVSAPPAVDDAVEAAEPRQEIDAIDEHGRAIEEKLAAAERESAALARELSSLDEAWSEKIDELAEAKSAVAAGPGEAAEPHETAQKPRAATNVVPLAARIKSIQRDASR